MRASFSGLALAASLTLLACGTKPATVGDGGPVGGLDGGGTPQDGGSALDGGALDGGATRDGGLDPDAGAPDGFDAALVSADVPSRMLPGATTAVTITLRNTGTNAWSVGSSNLDAAHAPDTLWGPAAVALAAAVAPGDSVALAFNVTAPAVPGRYGFRWRMAQGSAGFGTLVDLAVEVTCDDGVFCNGVEQFSNGHCVAGPNPCDDGIECTIDTCDEVSRSCEHNVAASGCELCRDCVPQCDGKNCGPDGCGGDCGTCDTGLACDHGTCAVPSGPGTCASPLPITPSGSQTIHGDTNLGVDYLTPSCATGSDGPEQVYSFTLDAPAVLDAQVTGFDTVLSLRTTCTSRASTIACNDDSVPPGWPGSRVLIALNAGTYFLIVDGYDAKNAGPYRLTVRFTPGACVPQCTNKFCGPDGCGGTCGTCTVGDCGDGGHCANPCARACEGKACGDDGCGGSCGSCGDGELCHVGSCVPGRVCDHFQPTCDPACSAGQFCGTDCVCRDVNAPLPDLVPDAEQLASSAAPDQVYFQSTSCALQEGCVGSTGWRNLLRFDVRAKNIGNADLVFGSPAARPDLYEWSPCHRHYHFTGFAEYELRDLDGGIVVRGRKQAFCLEDTSRVVDSPEVSCNAKYDCGNQGIQRGWSDVYRAALDCQWLDVTDVANGTYRLIVRLNPQRVIQELTLENNEASAEVTLP